MKKIMWVSVFVEFTMLIIGMSLVVLGKIVPDSIANIIFGSMVVFLLSSIIIERKNYIEHKLNNNFKVKKMNIYLSIIIFVVPLVLMLIINNIRMR